MGVLNFLSSIGKGLLTSDNLRDYQHASRTFTSNNHALLPKTRRWWHIYFEITPEAVSVIEKLAQQLSPDYPGIRGLSIGNYGGQAFQLSVLAKTVKLPSLRYETRRYNQYNRQILAVNKVSYDPVSVEFHDDALNVVRNFWQWYYLYHTQDSRYFKLSGSKNQGTNIQVPAWRQDNPSTVPFSSTYSGAESFSPNWGLDTVNTSYREGQALDRFSPFLSTVKIYHFSRPVDRSGDPETNASPWYSEYTLINPLITSCEHDTLDYATSESATHRMTLEYETVIYNQGQLPVSDTAASEIASWDQVQKYLWDSSKSPLSNPQASVLGKSGILETAGGIAGGLAGGLTARSVLTAGLSAGRAVQTWKNAGGVRGLTDSLLQEGRKVVNDSLREIQKASTTQQQISVPGGETTIGIRQPKT